MQDRGVSGRQIKMLGTMAPLNARLVAARDVESHEAVHRIAREATHSGTAIAEFLSGGTP